MVFSLNHGFVSQYDTANKCFICHGCKTSSFNSNFSIKPYQCGGRILLVVPFWGKYYWYFHQCCIVIVLLNYSLL
uniref:Uncharacterized protein n=1 Tax=Rhizophora mucronata TaxID=61149 RepID=A0A2P2QAY9_RHIMU